MILKFCFFGKLLLLLKHVGPFQRSNFDHKYPPVLNWNIKNIFWRFLRMSTEDLAVDDAAPTEDVIVYNCELFQQRYCNVLRRYSNVLQWYCNVLQRYCNVRWRYCDFHGKFLSTFYTVYFLYDVFETLLRHFCDFFVSLTFIVTFLCDFYLQLFLKFLQLLLTFCDGFGCLQRFLNAFLLRFLVTIVFNVFCSVFIATFKWLCNIDDCEK